MVPVRAWWGPVLSRVGLVSLRYEIATRSDVGRKRTENQDVGVFCRLDGGILGVVCDGMGGYSGGEVASRIAADAIIQYFQSLPRSALSAPFARLREAILWANRQIWEMAQNHKEIGRMGTTVVAVLCYKGRAYVAHVGDSRAYLLRDGGLLRITRDHSQVQRLVDEGKLRAEEAEHHPRSNVISRVLGQNAEVEVECQPAPIVLAAGDRLLLCSDGLSRMVDEQGLLYLLHQPHPPAQICESLIVAANEAGGKDNITAQVLDCVATPHMTGLYLFGLYLLLLLFLLWWVGVQRTSRHGARVLAPSWTTLRTSTTVHAMRRWPHQMGCSSSRWRRASPSIASVLRSHVVRQAVGGPTNHFDGMGDAWKGRAHRACMGIRIRRESI